MNFRVLLILAAIVWPNGSRANHQLERITIEEANPPAITIDNIEATCVASKATFRIAQRRENSGAYTPQLEKGSVGSRAISAEDLRKINLAFAEKRFFRGREISCTSSTVLVSFYFDQPLKGHVQLVFEHGKLKTINNVH